MFALGAPTGAVCPSVAHSLLADIAESPDLKGFQPKVKVIKKL
jgi:hypothetical protein